ncbi:MAG: isoprenyl transferase [Deltaproteobacteria bacterium]|nr:isoprenyl transferase [Deltaproteobacteria bacterium]MBW2199752.1 isoprenyl transferase [Deltaproteobacteria bacterium]
MKEKRKKSLNSSQSLTNSPVLNTEALPYHVAIIMDGNGRWAQKRFLNRIKGHRKGAETVRTIVRTCREIGISILTLYAFSTENWERPRSEVTALMALLKKFLESEQKEMLENNIRLNAIGQIERMPEDIQAALHQTMTVTENKTGMLLNLALSYGGRSEIVRMVREIAKKARDGEIDIASITPALVSENLYTRGIPDPDLLIRTSGEIRISNFLLWQIAYTEIFFTDTLWPDFTKEEFLQILNGFKRRERRYGKIES